MKKILSLLFILGVGQTIHAQSFAVNLSPAIRVIAPGDSTEFTITVNPLGGFNSPVYFQLTMPGCLNGFVNLNGLSVASPYTGVKIKVANSASFPQGVHQIVLQSYNGALVDLDTCQLIVSGPAGNQWRAYTTLNSPMPVANAKSTAIDKSGSFWAGISKGVMTAPGALLCFDQNKWYAWSTTGYKEVDLCGTVLFSSQDHIDNNGITSVCTKGDTVYASSESGIYQVVNKTLSKLPTPPIQAPEQFKTLKLDNQKNLWGSTYYGLYKYNGSSWTSFNFTGAPFGLPPSIEDFEFDNSGALWLATSGLHKYNGSTWTTYNSASGLSGNGFYSVSRSANGTIWAGSGSNGSVYKFSSVTGSFTAYPYAKGPYGATHDIAFDKNGNPLVASDVGLFLYNGSSWTVFSATNSPVQCDVTGNVVAIPWAASMDHHDNIIVANGRGGFLIKGVPGGAAVGLKEEMRAEDRYKIFPNPSNGRFRISGSGEETFELFIYDVNGVLVLKWDTVYKGTEISLEEGIYFARIIDGQKRSTSKKRSVCCADLYTGPC